jgi:hypothetical protein
VGPNTLALAQGPAYEPGMPVYIVESHEDMITHGEGRVRGVLAEGYKVYLYKLSINVTEDDIRRRWKLSRHGQDSKSVRRSPTGAEPWWICIEPSQARWPGTKERSNGKPIDG